jgi:hypothetical protein
MVTCHLVKDNDLAWRLYLFVALTSALGAMLYIFLEALFFKIDLSVEYLDIQLIAVTALFILISAVDRSILLLLARHLLLYFGLENKLPARTEIETKLADHIRPDVKAGSNRLIVYIVGILGAIIFMIARLESNFIRLLTSTSKIDSKKNNLFCK